MSDAHNIFISWSGDRSRWVATGLSEWLPLVVQAAKPFISTSMEKGTRGLEVIGEKLQQMKVGITVLTHENLLNPWINYEAGALTKTIDDRTRLCTFLLGGLKPEDVPRPLGTFQATVANKEQTYELVRTINKSVGDTPVSDANLKMVFDKMWPDFKEKLDTMPAAGSSLAPKRDVQDIVAEILKTVRAESDSISKLFERLERLEYLVDVSSRGAVPSFISAGSVPLSTLGQQIPSWNSQGGMFTVNAAPGYFVSAGTKVNDPTKTEKDK